MISNHPLVKVYVMREEVGDSVLMTSNVCEGVGEILKKSDPMCLTASDLLGFVEVLQIFMVCVDFDSVLCTKKEGATALKAKDDHSEFFIMDVIILLGKLQTVTVEANRVNTIGKFLENDYSKGETRGVSFQDESSYPVRSVEDWGGADLF